MSINLPLAQLEMWYLSWKTSILDGRFSFKAKRKKLVPESCHLADSNLASKYSIEFVDLYRSSYMSNRRQKKINRYIFLPLKYCWLSFISRPKVTIFGRNIIRFPSNPLRPFRCPTVGVGFLGADCQVYLFFFCSLWTLGTIVRSSKSWISKLELNTPFEWDFPPNTLFSVIRCVCFI